MRLSSRTIAFVRTSAPEAFATASGSAPSPVVSETKTGAGLAPAPAGGGRRRLRRRAGAGGSSEAAAPVSVACLRAAAASGASVAWKDRSSDRPAYTPPSSGSTSRSTISTPRREPMYSVTDTSPASARRGDSSLARATPSGGDDPGRGELVQVGGHAHELPAGQRAHRAPGVDGGRGDAGRDQVAAQADRGDQLDAFRPPGEERLGPLVHRHPGDVRRGQLPAQPGRAFQDRDP